MAATTTPLTNAGPGRKNAGSAPSFWARVKLGDEVAIGITFLCAFSVIAITAFLVWELWINSAQPRDKFGWHFLTTQTWDPVAGDFGALPFIYGTLVTSALALLIA